MYDFSSSKPTLLVIDDIPENLTLMYQLFKDDYKVKGANSGARGIAVAESVNPDLILLDIMMPEMDGYEVCRRLKHNPVTRDVPVIFLTAKVDRIDEQKGLEMGAVDYVTKPINPEIVKARVKTHVALKIASDLLKGKNEALEKEVERRTSEILRQEKSFTRSRMWLSMPWFLWRKPVITKPAIIFGVRKRTLSFWLKNCARTLVIRQS